MPTTSGLLTDLGQRLGTLGVMAIVLLAIAVVLALGLTLAVAGELLAASADPLQVAPFRWTQRC
jgi:hypothetical protein